MPARRAPHPSFPPPLLPGSMELRLRRGERLFTQGETISSHFFVESGRVRLERATVDGRLVPMARLDPGDWIAEASVFGDTYHCDAVAELATSLRAVARAELLRRIEQDESFAGAWLRRLAGEVQRLRLRLELGSIRRADDRLESWLRLRARDDPSGPPTVDLEAPLRDVAAELGLTPEALSRAFRSLEERGHLRRRKGRIVLLAPRTT